MVKRNIWNQPKGMPWWHWVSVEYRAVVGRDRATKSNLKTQHFRTEKVSRGTVARRLEIRRCHPWYLFLKYGKRLHVAVIIDRADRALRKYTGAGWIDD